MKRKNFLCVLGVMALVLGGCGREQSKDESSKSPQESSGAVVESDDNKKQSNEKPQENSQAQTSEASSDLSSDNKDSTSNEKNAKNKSNTGNTDNTMITADQAKAKALAHANLTSDKVTFVQSKLEREDGRQVYDVEFYTADKGEFDYDIDAYTGEIVKYDFDVDHEKTSESDKGGNAITEEEAKKMALERVPGASANDLKEFEKDYGDGRVEYEGKIIYNGVEYEFEINGSNGKFIDWEEEPANR